MGGAAVFGDTQGTQGRPLAHPVVQGHDTVGHELEKVVVGRRARLRRIRLRGHDRAQAATVHPFTEPEHLPADVRRVGQVTEEHVETIENDAACSGLLRPGRENREEPDEIEVTALLDRLRELRVDDVDPSSVGSVATPGEAGGVLEDSLRTLLERDDNPRLVAVAGAAREHLHAEDRLSGACPAEDDGDPTTREATVGDLVETRDPARHPPKGVELPAGAPCGSSSAASPVSQLSERPRAHRHRSTHGRVLKRLSRTWNAEAAV